MNAKARVVVALALLCVGAAPVVGLAAFYIGKTMWLWWDWGKLRKPR